jgi:hypothetical protein
VLCRVIFAAIKIGAAIGPRRLLVNGYKRISGNRRRRIAVATRFSVALEGSKSDQVRTGVEEAAYLVR